MVIDKCGYLLHEDKPAEMAQMINGIMTQRKIPVEWNTEIFIMNAAGKKVIINR